MSALREIIAHFGVEFDTAALEAGNKKIDSTVGRLKEFGKAVLEAFAFEKVVEFTEATTEQAAAIGHAAEATGLSTRELQAWQLGAKEAGVEGDEFTMALRRLSSSMAGGSDEAGTGAKLFAELGIKTKDTTGNVRALGDVLPEIAERFKGMADGPKKAAEAQAIFGRQGARLIPLLNEGSEGVQKLKADFDDLGGGFSPEFVKQAQENEKQSKRLSVAWDHLKEIAAGPLLDAMGWVVSGLIKLAKWASKLVQGTNVATSAMIVFGTIAAAQIAKVVAANAPLILEWGLIALAIGLVILAVDELITTWQGGDTIITRIVDKIWGEGATARAVGSIKTIQNAFSELFATASNNSDEFHSTWQKTINDIQNDTDGFGGYWSGFLAAMTDAGLATVEGLTNGWQRFWDFMSGMVDGLMFSFDVVWDDIKYAGLGVAAALSDAFDRFLNHLGPITDLAKKLGLELGNGTAGEGVAADRAANNKARFAQAADIDDRIRGNGQYAPKSSTRSVSADGTEYVNGAGDHGAKHVTIHNTTNVNVGAGTPGHVAHQVGKAAALGASGAHRKAAAALAQGGNR